ncbi:MAG: prolyl oligopeptidase family serine peptidase [Verrucomicrobiae bacterium]|nr:prolyl oligopeptidase family serine peptidase [Verrucomicrobiae bacterium]
MVKDVLGAVEYAKKNANVDSSRIYLVGVSGGGMAALLMAGRAPGVWTAVSSWCPIFDLKDWHRETLARKLVYAQMIEKSCGGAPGSGAAVDEEYRKRSPSTWLDQAKSVPLDINTGIADGHKGSVPVSHSLKAFNVLAATDGRIAETDIAAICAAPQMPPGLLPTPDDPLYRRGKALYRKISGQTRVTVFEGGHAILAEAALAWLEKQRRGQPPVWEIKDAPDVDLSDLSTQAGK